MVWVAGLGVVAVGALTVWGALTGRLAAMIGALTNSSFVPASATSSSTIAGVATQIAGGSKNLNKVGTTNPISDLYHWITGK